MIAGQRPGRQSDQDVTLFKAVGTGLLDLALAIAIYERAREPAWAPTWASSPKCAPSDRRPPTAHPGGVSGRR